MPLFTHPFPAIAAISPDLSWAHSPYPAFPGASDRDSGTVCILPIYNFADHGLGLPLDVEEVIASAVLSAAVESHVFPLPLRVLPPVRFGLSPYGTKLGSIDAETTQQLIREICIGIKQAGYQRLLFWVTSPWNYELIDVVSRDTRIELGLQTFLMGLRGVGLGLHPAKGNRAAAQAVAAHLLKLAPEPTSPPSATSIDDKTTRPGNWTVTPSLALDQSLDASQLLSQAALAMSQLLAEVVEYPNLDGSVRSPAPVAIRHKSVTEFAAFPISRRERYLPSLTTTALASLSPKKNGLVIIPVGAIEQHGPHLPVGVDSFLGEAVLQSLAARLPPEALVWFGPSITYGKSNEHLTFPGSLSVSAQTLRRLLIALALQLKTLGFHQLAFLNTHGGNSSVIDYTLRELQSEHGLVVEHLRLPPSAELSAQERAWGFHAGEWETSLMLALTPDLVDQTKVICHYPVKLDDPGQLRPESAPVIYAWQTSDLAPDGVMGDATAATAAKGHRWFEEAMQKLSDAVIRLI